MALWLTPCVESVTWLVWIAPGRRKRREQLRTRRRKPHPLGAGKWSTCFSKASGPSSAPPSVSVKMAACCRLPICPTSTRCLRGAEPGADCGVMDLYYMATTTPRWLQETLVSPLKIRKRLILNPGHLCGVRCFVWMMLLVLFKKKDVYISYFLNKTEIICWHLFYFYSSRGAWTEIWWLLSNIQSDYVDKAYYEIYFPLNESFRIYVLWK